MSAATHSRQSDCGCGCGGASVTPSAFVRPRFFAGQLLTEDDLSLLVDYVAGKDRLHNRMVSGPGVVCGLEVSCDPCGGGTVAVHPGHALDCCGNDIVLSCKEKVDVAALVRELKVSSLGVDCGDPCDDDQRHFGLFVRYEESSIDPVAPYATEEPCPSPDCSPSRIQEGFRFLVKCDTTDDHRYNPVSKLMSVIGPEGPVNEIRTLAQRLGFYLDPMSITVAASDRKFLFNSDDQTRFRTSLAQLLKMVDGPVTAPVAPGMTEEVRALASAIARYDTYDATGQADLLSKFSELDDVDQAREVLGRACDLLAATNQEEAWPDQAHRAVAQAVVAEAKARIALHDTHAPLEVRLLAQGTPIDNVLAVRFRSDLVRIREWLLGRLDRAPGVADCTLRDRVRAAPVPQPLPTPEPNSGERLALPDLQQLAEAAGVLTAALQGFVVDAMCSTLNPPCTDCTDTDVLLAHLELDGCDVVRVCSATREQVLPGGSAYGEWLPKLFPLREYAKDLCCQPAPVYRPPEISGDPVPTPYVPGLLKEWVRTGLAETMWNELMKRAPGETLPVHEQVTVPSEVTDSLHELSALRTQVSELIATVTALRAQLDSARDQVSQVREQLPERLADRLAELESAPPAAESPAESEPEPEPTPEPPKPPARRRSSSSRTQKPKSGESS
jgi:hypothetical protein